MQKSREHWGSLLGFVLAAAGSAIGLGTLWKFPYVTGENGGGLFVLIYIFCIFFVGVPVFIAELLLGRKAQRAAVGIFENLSNNSAVWKTAGWLGVISSFLILSFYSVLAGWGLNYVLMSLTQFYMGKSAEEISNIFDILASSADITLFWHAIFMSLTMGVVYLGVKQGIEYWSKFMTIGLFILLLALAAYTVTLPGLSDAIDFLFKPDYSKFKATSALDALGLAFFTLSLVQGVMLTYGSYMRKNEDVPKMAGIIASMIIFVALMAGIVIFPIIFTFGFEPQGGPGLVFKVLPVLFAKLPGSIIISTLFFVLFVFAALTSAVALIEVVVANFIDLFDWSRKKAVLITGVSCFIFGIPSALALTHTLFANWQKIYGRNFFNTIDDLVSLWLLPIGGLMIALFTGWFCNRDSLKEEFENGAKWKWLFKPWLFFIRWIAPTAIILIILEQTGLVSL